MGSLPRAHSEKTVKETVKHLEQRLLKNLKMAAYHLEALRRQRVIDRKQGALARLYAKEEEEERKRQEELARSAWEKQEAEENRRYEREEHLRQRGGANGDIKKLLDKTVGEVKKYGAGDLRYQKKTLRDHGLVMGHITDKYFS